MHTRLLFHHKSSMRLLYGILSPKRTKIKLRWYREELPRFACNDHRREASVTIMLDEPGWRSLKQRRADQRLIMLYKIVNNLVEVDLSKELIPLTKHSRNSHAKSFRIPYEKKTYLQYNFLPRTIKQWNSLLATLATASSLHVFKSGVCELKN